jgi:hypothetical protein
MTRFLTLTAASIVLAACDVGSVLERTGVDGNGPPSDGPPGGTDGSGSGSDCETLAAPNGDGHHNAGMGCLSNAGCHNAGKGLGANAPEFSFGGTIYKDATNPYPGATVLLTANGVTKKIITGTNGNFYVAPITLAAPTALAPVNTKASACPSTTAMSGALVAAGGDCNSSSCHGGTQGKIHLP